MGGGSEGDEEQDASSLNNCHRHHHPRHRLNDLPEAWPVLSENAVNTWRGSRGDLVMTMIMVTWMLDLCNDDDDVDDGDGDIKLCEYQALASEKQSPQYRKEGWPTSPFQHDGEDGDDHVDSWPIEMLMIEMTVI